MSLKKLTGWRAISCVFAPSTVRRLAGLSLIRIRRNKHGQPVVVEDEVRAAFRVLDDGEHLVLSRGLKRRPGRVSHWEAVAAYLEANPSYHLPGTSRAPLVASARQQTVLF